jgi:hypothetical protein
MWPAHRHFAARIVLVLLTSCSPHGSVTGPVPAAHQAQPANGFRPGTSGTIHVRATRSLPAGSPVITGKIYAVAPGVISVKGDAGCGYTNVRVDGSTSYQYNGISLAVGTYVQAWGTGSCASGVIQAATVALWNMITVSGPISGTTPQIIEVQSPDCGYIDAFVDDQTQYTLNGLLPSVGTPATISGLGTCSAYLGTTYAVALGNVSRPSPTPVPAPSTIPSTISQTHALTADYLGGGSGTRSVSWPNAARYLTWAESIGSDLRGIAAAGIHTMLYTDPNRTAPGDFMYTSDESTFAHACNGSRLSFPIHANLIQNLMDPSSPALGALWRQHVDGEARNGPIDAVFDDDPYDLYGMDGTPCGYAPLAWLLSTTAMIENLPYRVIFSNLAGNSSTNLLSAKNAIGGATEDCYATNSQPTPPYATSDLWTMHLNLQLMMSREQRLFFCYNNPTLPASNATAVRTYVYASFMLAFDPTSSVLWEYFTTPSGLHVMPESQLVPAYPLIPAPYDVSGLAIAPGVYAREYRACYMSGTLTGACSAVVNENATPVGNPMIGYTKSLILSGNGIMDGGSASVQSGVPATLPGYSGLILFR